ncbi:alpha/beta hydrolase [Herbiconiux sp.]|uniref:alpha/beta fold hydrolase n=1 Tax=Herbiconiux sp. TaxID=1871186 RepID=UPI0025C12DC4|nr:alpha/beta hydrolase [Herbiconiux sp.]
MREQLHEHHGERMLSVNGVDLCIAEFGEEGGQGLVLVPGASSASDWWDDAFCEALAAGGLRVVRYDLRDTGRSTTRPLGRADYTGDDLVEDLAALIRALDLVPAHVVGLSLGGGLAQQLAIAHPETLASLTLLSTSPGGDDLPPMSPELAASFDEASGSPADSTRSDREAHFREALADERRFGGTIPVDEQRIRRIADRVFDRSIDLEAGANHWGIPSASGTRAQLADIAVPTLVVHGTADPLFPLAHGEALAREIPDARLLAVPGLGHQFPPPETWDLIVPALLEHVRSAG